MPPRLDLGCITAHNPDDHSVDCAPFNTLLGSEGEISIIIFYKKWINCSFCILEFWLLTGYCLWIEDTEPYMAGFPARGIYSYDKNRQ